MKWGQVRYCTILFGEENLGSINCIIKQAQLSYNMVAGYHTISGFLRETDSTRDCVCFTKKTSVQGIHKKYFCTRDHALTRDSGSTRDRKSTLYSIFLEPRIVWCSTMDYCTLGRRYCMKWGPGAVSYDTLWRGEPRTIKNWIV